MILVNDEITKYIQFLPIFLTSSGPFTLHVETIHKMNQKFVHCKYWLNYFLATE